MLRSLLTVLLLVCLQYAFASEHVVQISEGSVGGHRAITRNGRQIWEFTNIPYAEPPVGELRFKNPVPKRPWHGVINVEKRAHECPQFRGNGLPSGDEDCLILNVYTPRLPNHKEPLLPVMVYVHGGGYVAGNSSDINYGPQYLLDKDVVLVSMNYRLGVLGFLSTGDLELPGNFGLKDQQLALKWVQRNIQAFGGDRNRVTLFGESAGASSVGLHTISDGSKDLYQQYILQSGTFLNSWAILDYPWYYEYPKKVAKKYNCPTDNSRAMAQCLRTLTTEQLLNETATSDEPMDAYKIVWAPTVEPESEGAFLTDHPINLIRENKTKNCPFITGVVGEEGLLISASLYVNDDMFKLFRDRPEYVMTKLMEYYEAGTYSDLNSLVKKMKKFYFGDEMPVDKDTIIQKYTAFVSDCMFFYPQVRLLKYLEKSNKYPFYFYNFEYLGSLSHTMFATQDNATYGVSHADDLIYLFPITAAKFLPYLHLRQTENDRKVIDVMVDLWTSFAITSNPSSCHVGNPHLWKPYNLNKRALVIGNRKDPSTYVRDSFYKQRMDFWFENVPESTFDLP